MALPHAAGGQHTFLVECFGTADALEAARGSSSVDREFLATLAIADDEQLLVLVRDTDAASVERRCIAAGLTVDRVVEVALSPAWRWNETAPARRRTRASPR